MSREIVSKKDVTFNLLRQVCDILECQNKPSIANQGQVLDGYSALANYNSVAKKIAKFLKEYDFGKEKRNNNN